ncbi:MAG: TonB-dependent receptor [Congregibacter sp.]|nr:TonB-dependent receptor [Congregibacter sp.]
MTVFARAAHFGAAVSIYCMLSTAVLAQSEQSCVEGACTLSYQAAFFTRYAPVTALDMVNNLPGFALDDGDRDTRGFGGAAGNIVINGARVSAKTETPTAILSRIPASDIERIDVIRGQVAGLDIRGQNVIANIIRSGTSSSGAWTAGVRTFQPDTNVYPDGELSYSTDVAGSQVTLGIAGRQFQTLVARRERVLGPDTLPLEKRFELSNLEGERIGATLNASSTFGQTRTSLNLGRASFSTEGGESSRRFPEDGSAPFLLFQGDGDRIFRDEFGFDAERPLFGDWRGKIIGLYGNRVNTAPESLIRGPLDEIGVTEVLTRERTATQEIIGRLELDYSGFDGHTIELNFEASNNSLDSEFSLSALENGLLLPQPVPGANSEVEEERFDVLVSDAFEWGGISIDAGIGAETSTITQVGGFSGDRSFFFLKPSLNMSYSPRDNSQWRLRALRQVGQLDFQDFVSGADLGDGELALGNPELAPETTVTVDLSYEVRGEDFGIGTVTLFHNWIDDVNDLLPLTGVLEVPGNIGSATRAGILGELTVSLDSLGLPNGRMDASAQWQTSRVDDPLTLLPRALSDERQWEASMSIRQDIQEKRLAWGVTMFARDTFPLYGIDEIDIQGQRADMDLFIETRAFEGLRIRLTIEDLFRDGESRDRRVFAGDRSVAPLAFREVREQSQARIVSLQLSGDF